jgi:TM2 domain-containing membrane protein YozV
MTRHSARYSDPGTDLETDMEIIERNSPSPGIAAVLSVLLPGLGQVYAGRLFAGALWFLGTAAAYSLILVPGFLVHAVCIWSAYQSARWWDGF